MTWSAKELSVFTMVLKVSASCATSPRASIVTVRVRSALATAAATWEMFRTCTVRFFAIRLTLSLRSFQMPTTPGTCAWPPRMPSVPTSRATRVTCSAKDDSWSTMVLTVVTSSRISPLASTVIFFDRSPLRRPS